MQVIQNIRRTVSGMPNVILMLLGVMAVLPWWSLTFSQAPWQIVREATSWQDWLPLLAFWALPAAILILGVTRSILFIPAFLAECLTIAIVTSLKTSGLPEHLVALKFVFIGALTLSSLFLLNRDLYFPMTSRAFRLWRRGSRFDVNWSLRLKDEGGETPLVLENCMPTGLGLSAGRDALARSLGAFPKGKVVTLEIAHRTGWQPVTGTVRWYQDVGPMRRIGIQIEAADELAKYLALLPRQKARKVSALWSITAARRAVMALWMGSMLGTYMTPACKPKAAESQVADLATSSEFKSGAFLPKMPQTYAFKTSATKKTVAEMMSLLGGSPVNGVIYFTTVSAQGEHFLIASPNVQTGRKTYPIVVGSVDRSGRKFSYSAYVAMDAAHFLITDTFVKHEVGTDEPLNPVNMYVMRKPKSNIGVVEPVLVPWLRHVKSETGTQILYRFGNDILSTQGDNPVYSYDEIGNQVWQLRGAYEDQDLVAGTIVWSRDLETYYSIRPDTKAVTLWKKQDEDSMDRVKRLARDSDEYPKVPSVVERSLASAREIMANDKAYSGFRGVDACMGDSSVIQLYRACGNITAGTGLGLTTTAEPVDDDDFFEFPGNRVGDRNAGYGMSDNRVYLGRSTTAYSRQWKVPPNPLIGVPGADVLFSALNNQVIYTTLAGRVPDGEIVHNSYFNPATGRVEIESRDGVHPPTVRFVDAGEYMRTLESANSPETLAQIQALRLHNKDVLRMERAVFNSAEASTATYDKKKDGAIVSDVLIDASIGSITNQVMPKGSFGPTGLLKEAAAKGVANVGKKLAKDMATGYGGVSYLYDLGQEFVASPISQAVFGSTDGSGLVKGLTDIPQAFAKGEAPITPGSVIKVVGDFAADKVAKVYFPPGISDGVASFTKGMVVLPASALADYATVQAISNANSDNMLTETNLTSNAITSSEILRNLYPAYVEAGIPVTPLHRVESSFYFPDSSQEVTADPTSKSSTSIVQDQPTSATFEEKPVFSTPPNPVITPVTTGGEESY